MFRSYGEGPEIGYWQINCMVLPSVVMFEIKDFLEGNIFDPVSLLLMNELLPKECYLIRLLGFAVKDIKAETCISGKYHYWCFKSLARHEW